MRVAIGSDEKTELTDFVVDYLEKRGWEVVLFGALGSSKQLWSEIGESVAKEIVFGKADEGILFCWTGTGVALAANKVPGIRAVTVSDFKTAENAKEWDHANVLCLSCFLSKSKAKKILDAWFSAEYSNDLKDLEAIKILKKIERKYLRRK